MTTKQLILASRPRSGTHFLRGAISSLPGVSTWDEPFHPEYVAGRVLGYWDMLRTPVAWLTEFATGDLCVWAIHWRQRLGWGSAMHGLRSMQPAVVILYRRDLLAQFCSFKFADMSGEWRSSGEFGPQTRTLTVDLTELDLWCRMQRLSVADDLHWWATTRPLLMAYEDLLSDFRGQLQRLGDYLGRCLLCARPHTQRRELRPLQQVVANYDAAVAVASRYPFEESAP